MTVGEAEAGRKYKPEYIFWRAFGWSFVGGPLIILGLLLCLTVIGLPLGVALIHYGTKPYTKLIMQQAHESVRMEADAKWLDDDNDFNEDKEVPWET